MTLNSELIALIVHDLKNPLAALLSNLGFVASAVKHDEMTSEAVQDCLLSTEVLSRLIENLAVVGSLESNGSDLQGEVFVPSILTSVEKRMKRHAETAMSQISFSCDPSVKNVSSNSKMLELALDNLIATSMAYAPSNTLIQVKAVRKNGEVSIAVVDEGPTIKDELKSLLIDKIGQAQIKNVQGVRYGRGLGLYVVGLIARVSGGELRITELGETCAFEIVLPALN